MIERTVTDPLNTRVLDPACGSGTFLFHAVRDYIAAAEKASLSIRDTLEGVARHVIGMDLHPVAVTLDWDKASIWTGRLSRTNAPWSEASTSLSHTEGVVRRTENLPGRPTPLPSPKGLSLLLGWLS